MEIKLYHKHYDEKHLAEVIDQMQRLGAPRVCGMVDHNGIFNAFEGCHRVRAAKILGIDPICEEATDEDIARIAADAWENNGDVITRETLEERVGDYYKAEFIEF